MLPNIQTIFISTNNILTLNRIVKLNDIARGNEPWWCRASPSTRPPTRQRGLAWSRSWKQIWPKSCECRAGIPPTPWTLPSSWWRTSLCCRILCRTRSWFDRGCRLGRRRGESWGLRPIKQCVNFCRFGTLLLSCHSTWCSVGCNSKNIYTQTMDLFSRRRWRLVSAQVVSCCLGICLTN